MNNSSHPNTALRINVTVTDCETVKAEINTDNAGSCSRREDSELGLLLKDTSAAERRTLGSQVGKTLSPPRHQAELTIQINTWERRQSTPRVLVICKTPK